MLHAVRKGPIWMAPRRLNGAVLRAFSMTAGDNKRVVIIGGVAGGATAAARLMRLNNKTDVTVIERSPDVSFANCGLPYYIGGEIKDRSALALQTPESLSASLGVKVLVNTDAVSIDRKAKTIATKNMQGKNEEIPYDVLILSPGASPLTPPVPGINDPRVMTLRNLVDMDRIDAFVKKANVKSVAVIGAGFIGLEMVEQLVHIGKKVHLIEKAPAVLPQADEEMAEFLHGPLVEHGVDLICGDGLARFEDAGNAFKVVLESGKEISVDLVVLSIGVRPESQLAKAAELELNPRGYVAVNEYMQTNDPAIYAVGDVIETADLVFPERKATIALGNVANMQARIAADHIVRGKSIPYRGSLGTSIVRAFDTVLALTGWNERRLKAEGIAYATTTITDNNHAGYYPGALPITLKLLFDPESGRIFGGQAVGVEGVDKRIDVIAMAITGGLSIHDLSLAQLSYSPPFGSARDVTNVAALASRNISDGLVFPAYSADGPSALSSPGSKIQLVDARPQAVAEMSPLPNAINIPYADIKARAKDLDPSVEYRTVCAMGKTAYFASRNLIAAGLKSSTLIGGMRLHHKPLPEPPASGPEASASAGAGAGASAPSAVVGKQIELDCAGMACPGPLLKLKSMLPEMQPGVVLSVKATDPGFKGDVKAFAASNNLALSDVRTEKGVIHAKLTLQATIGEVAGQVAAAGGGGAVGSRKGATIVVFSQDYDKVLGAFVIANGAAAMGGEVTMFFTFWGLNALRDPARRSSKPKAFMDYMFGKMMPKGIDKMPLSNMNFAGIGPVLLKGEMAKKQLPNLPGLMQNARDQKIRMVACTMSMDAMGVQPSELIDGVEYGGVAEYLGAAEKAGTNLFI